MSKLPLRRSSDASRVIPVAEDDARQAAKEAAAVEALKPCPRVWHYEPEPVEGMPAGYHKVPAELVCLNPETGRLVVFGTPHQEAPDNAGHSCDEMGCGWHHALLVAEIVQPERLLELPDDGEVQE